jgi:hypothetical protein
VGENRISEVTVVMKYPFTSLSPDDIKRVFWPLLLITILLMVCLNAVGSSLTTIAAPYGIISYEVAGDVQKAAQILSSWDQNVQLRAAFSLGFDYVFLAFYSTTIGLACVWTARVLQGRQWPLAQVGIPLAWGQWLAALLDAIENLALVVMLFDKVTSPWPQIAYWCAIVKFGLVFLGLVYGIFGLVVKLLVKETIRV